ncbi:hypothetical protein [Neobacillus soli]|uniref:hypothetical protein n=1 Tax=Neobacillus soli TaxID=220688 RepID=UPI000A9A5444|nr:hypothetical protein [Neobacillus soli]
MDKNKLIKHLIEMGLEPVNKGFTPYNQLEKGRILGAIFPFYSLTMVKKGTSYLILHISTSYPMFPY